MDARKPIVNKTYTLGSPGAEAVREMASRARRTTGAVGLVGLSAERRRQIVAREARLARRVVPVEPMS
jgi:hypothetical protein